MRVSFKRYWIAAALTIGVAGSSCIAAFGQSVSVPWAASPWAKGYNSTSRLVAGNTTRPGGDSGPLAGIEIHLGDGWKTYWRQPGDNGGVAPNFDWSASTNLAEARVLFPVPERLKDANGQSIGYKKAVVLPVVLTPRDPSKPVALKLAVEYGICREICVPAEARLELAVPPGLGSAPPELTSAVAKVPHAAGTMMPGDPALVKAASQLGGASPGLTFDIAPGKAGSATAGTVTDLFVEATDGAYLPMTERVAGAASGAQRFRIDLKGVDDIASLKGKTLRLTMVGSGGTAEASWTIQ